MKAIEAATILNTYAKVYPDVELTFANNKVPVTKIVYDEKTGSINLR